MIKTYKDSDSADVRKYWLKKFKEDLPVFEEKQLQR
jgi:hypothetical protein